MNVTVFGTGYVGCTTAACHPDVRHSVTGVRLTRNQDISYLTSGKSPVIEPELGDLILRGVDAGRLQARQRVHRLGDISLICVGTTGNVLSRLVSVTHG